MANIAENLRKILASRFGKDVRQAIHDSISDINEIAEGQEQLINSHIQDAEAWAKGTKNGEAVESTDPAYHNNSKYYSEQADTDRLTSEAFAKGTHDGTAVESGTEGYHDNAKYYKEQAETAEDNAEHWYQETLALSQTLANAIIARGTVAFADLPDVTSVAVKNGFMYNISDNFTTTSDFVEGAGVNIPMGANVYKVTINNTPMWDILAGSSAAVFVGTEAQIAQADTQGLISENTMIISLDGEAPYGLTSSMILHGSDSVENVLDGLSDDTVKNNTNNTLVGVQSLEATNISRGQPISTGTYGDTNISFVDKDHKRLGFIQAYQNTDGSTDIVLNMDGANQSGRFKASVFKDYTNAVTGETDTTAGGTIRKGNETIYYDISFKLNSAFSGLKQVGHITIDDCYPYSACIGQVHDSNFQLFGSALIKGNSDIIVRTSQQLSANTYYYIKALGMVQNQN